MAAPTSVIITHICHIIVNIIVTTYHYIPCFILDVSQVGQSQHVGLTVDLVDGHNTSEL